MPIHFYCEDIRFVLKDKTIIRTWICDTCFSFGKKPGRINYIFCSNPKILEINKSYLKHNYYTDIISFDYSDEKKVAGDIYISIDTVYLNSIQFETSFYDELHRVLIHGVLHFLGKKDKSIEQIKEMRFEENLALHKLKQFCSTWNKKEKNNK
jgi:rRNA maturation RNase YbeY